MVIWNQQPFGNIPNQNKIVNPKTGTEIEITALLNSVKNDIVSGERGKQWLLSCYAPYKEKPLYPGFIDMSFEEVRFGFIEAQKSNMLQQYSQQLQQLLTEAKTRFKSLENPTKEIVELLKNIYNSNLNAGQQTQNGSVFGQSNASNSGSIFAQKQNTTFQQSSSTQNNENLFGQQSSTGSIFGQKSGSIFGQQQSGGVLGQQTSGSILGQQTSGSIFGQQQSGSIFGQQQSGSIFGQTNTATARGIFGQNNTNNIVNNAQTSIFGKTSVFGQQNQNAGSVFGGQQSTSSSTSIFGQQNNPPSNIAGFQSNNTNSANIFSQTNTVPQSTGSIFGSNPSQSSSSNIFQSIPSAENVPQTNNIFKAQDGNLFKPNHQMGVFGNAQPTTLNLTPQKGSLFAQAPEQGSQQSQNSIFQTATNKPQSSSIFGFNPTNTLQNNPHSGKPLKRYIEWGAYSKKDELTEAEIKWFNDSEFDIDNIPEKPPSYEMCF